MIFRFGLPILCIVVAYFVDDPAKRPDKPESGSAQQSGGKDGDVKPNSKRLVAPDDASLLRTLEKQSAPSQTESDPLERIDQHMRDVQQRLAQSDSGDETQTLQKEIVDDLETLIEQAKKGGNNNKQQQGKQKRQTSSKQVGQQAQPNNQASEPQDGAKARPGDVSDEQKAANARIVRAVWGHLPEKMREEMQQASQDTGLPKYRSLIELYFRAIAEQNESRRHAAP
jgi:hypothetical protein